MKGKLLVLLLTVLCMGLSLVPEAHAAVTVNSGHTAYSSGGSETDHVVDAPSHSQGDIIYLAVACDDEQTIVWPDGFAAIYHDAIEDTATWGLAWKLAGSSEPETYTFSLPVDDERAVAICWSQSHDAGIDDTSSVNEGDSATATCNAAVTSVADALILRIVATDGETVPHEVVSGYTQIAEMELYSGGSISVQYTTQTAIGSTGSVTVGLSATQEWGSGTVAIKPASSGPTTYTINAIEGPGGSIDPSGGITVNEGDDQSFTITADSGYTILDVVVDSVSQGAIGSYTFTDVTADHTIVANFEEVSTPPPHHHRNCRKRREHLSIRCGDRYSRRKPDLYHRTG